MRQGLAVAAGVTCGMLPVTGSLGFLIFILVVGGVGIGFFGSFTGVKEGAYGNVNLTIEGMSAAGPLFIIVWTMSYTFFHMDEVVAAAAEAAVAAAAASTAVAEEATNLPAEVPGDDSSGF